MADTEHKSMTNLMDDRILQALEDMKSANPRDQEALGGLVEKLLRAKPLASGGGNGLHDLLLKLDRELTLAPPTTIEDDPN